MMKGSVLLVFISVFTLTVTAQLPMIRQALRPLYKDCFADAAGQIFWFDRDASGKVVGMHVGGSRMRDMPFARTDRK